MNPRSEGAASSTPAPTLPGSGRAGFWLDVVDRCVLANGHAVRLTDTEFRLLTALVRQRGTVLSRDRAIATVWGRGFRGCRRALDVYVSRLRSKLREVITLETEHGVGYRLV